MGHDDERTAEAAATERLEHEHPARPERPNEGFVEGVDHKPDAPEEQREPNYARGIAHQDPLGTQRRGRFSDSAERSPTSE